MLQPSGVPALLTPYRTSSTVGDDACPEQHRCGLGGWQHRLGLDPALELLMEPFDRVAGARLFHWLRGSSAK